MKLLIITFLIMMLIWQGCYSYFPIEKTQNINLNDYDKEDVKLDLIDGTEITSKAYTHKMIMQPSDFIMGMGTLTSGNLENGTSTFSLYEYNSNEFDSVKTAEINGNDIVTCYLKNGNQINYEGDNYLKVGPNDGIGYFIRGEVKKEDIKKIKTSRVQLSEIENVELKRNDFPVAVVLILGLVIIVGAVVGSSYRFGGFKL